jgi:hypothetical protein
MIEFTKVGANPHDFKITILMISSTHPKIGENCTKLNQ